MVTEILSWLCNVDNQDFCRNVAQDERILFLELLNLAPTPPGAVPTLGTTMNFERLNQIPESQQRIIRSHFPPSFFDQSLWNSKAKVKNT